MHVLCSAATSRIHSPSIPNETDELTPCVQRLYELGARRVIVTGTGPLGCVPAELAQHSSNGECAAELNRAVDLFNPQLVDMVRGLNRDAGADVFVSANAYRANFDYLANPQSYGKYVLACRQPERRPILQNAAV